MRVICPHTGSVMPQVRKALEAYAPETEYVKVSGLYGYGEAVAERWDGSDDLVIVEHDNEITEEVMPSFSRCNQEWCCFGYYCFPKPYRKMTYVGLGCTRYSATIQKQIPTEKFICPDPDWMPLCRLCDGKGCWRSLDTRISYQAVQLGAVNHIHGEIPHHHKFPDPETWVRELINTYYFDERWMIVASICPRCESSLAVTGTKLFCSNCDFQVKGN